jgi:hypothetical protein
MVVRIGGLPVWIGPTSSRAAPPPSSNEPTAWPKELELWSAERARSPKAPTPSSNAQAA